MATTPDVRISLAGDRVALHAPWSPAMPTLCKSVSGARWDAEGKAWTYPLSMATLRSLRGVFGDRLAVRHDLNAWAWEAVKKEQALKALGGQRDAELQFVDTVAPRLAAAMASRTYQRVAARFAATAGSFLLADEPGLGKTATALAALIESDAWYGDVLVIAPKTSLKSVWARQIALWTDATAIAAPEGKAARKAAWVEFTDHESGIEDRRPRFFIVNPAMIRRKYTAGEAGKTRVIEHEDYPEVLNHRWDSIILDESHDLLSTVKAVSGPAKNKFSQQTAGLFDLVADRRYALTGTPLRGQERKVWGTLAWLEPDVFKAYWTWIDQYFNTTEGYGGSREIGSLRDSAAFGAMLDQHMLRRTRAEVRADLPTGQILDVLVEMSAEQKKQYQEFTAMGEARLRDGLVVGAGVLSELIRLKQLAYGPGDRMEDGSLVPSGDSPKADWLLQWLRERGVAKRDGFLPESGGYKYVVASQFTQVIDAVERRLNAEGIPTLKITGAVTGKARDRAQEIFQDDTRDRAPRVMLINTKAGGVSIELDAWCDEMVILDETWINDDQVQLRGRIDNRSGRVAPRTFWYVRTADTIEQSIAERNFAQADLQHALLDGRRGVETALHLLRAEAA